MGSCVNPVTDAAFSVRNGRPRSRPDDKRQRPKFSLAARSLTNPGERRVRRKLAAGVPFIPDDELSRALAEAGVEGTYCDRDRRGERRGSSRRLRSALSVLAVIALVALFFSSGVPTRQPGATA